MQIKQFQIQSWISVIQMESLVSVASILDQLTVNARTQMIGIKGSTEATWEDNKVYVAKALGIVSKR